MASTGRGGPDDVVETRERARMRAAETSWALRDLTRASAALDHALARRLRMSPLEYAAMAHVMGAGGDIGPLQLSSLLGISSGSATELVDRLEVAGHLRRDRSQRDRRRVSLRATDHAVALILGELADVFARVDALGDEMSPQEQHAVNRYLRGVAAIMWSFEADPPRDASDR